jgi:cytochrome c
MKLLPAALFAATALVATNAMANADLAKKSNCLACHTTDKKLVGPAYQDVAKKYAGNKGAEAMLIAKVKKGGVGVWGNVPMPPNANVKDEDIKTLVKWILAGAK